jgi:two-component system phosphate regulon sensor histidine kinase PhoR
MNWLLARVLMTALLVTAGTFVGGTIGLTLQAPILGTAVGAVVSAALAALVDGLRAWRLIRWLRSDHSVPGPRDPGVWGEAAYRVDRALRQRERALADQRDRLAQFLNAIEASPNGVLLIDENDQIEWLNRTAASHFGLDPQRDRMQRVTNLVRAPAFVGYLQREELDGAVTFPAPAGDRLLQVIARRYAGGMRLVLSLDITERERAEAMRRDFVANVSHEIRTPLTVLSGFVETIANLPLTEVERQRVLGLMEQQTARMQTLVEDLLTLAKLEGSPRPPVDRWLPISRLFAQVEAEARGLSAGRHVLDFHPDVRHLGDDALSGNDSEWVSAVANLVSNAVRYTPAGGRIDARWIRRDDGGGEIVVQDTGPGIAKEHLARLTERFYRVDGSRSRETGGTGLGLSIVKHVVQRHDGELDVQSEVGTGSTFRILVPAARIRPAVEVSAVTADARDGR